MVLINISGGGREEAGRGGRGTGLLPTILQVTGQAHSKELFRPKYREFGDREALTKRDE